MEKERIEERKTLVTRTPDAETLEEFMKGIAGGDLKVVFNAETGEFEWLVERPDHTLGQAKTQYGEDLKRL